MYRKSHLNRVIIYTRGKLENIFNARGMGCGTSKRPSDEIIESGSDEIDSAFPARTLTEGSGQERLCDTDVTVEWLLNCLQQCSMGNVPEKPSFIAERIGQHSEANSTIIRVTFGWKSDVSLPDTVVVKIPSVHGALQRALDSRNMEHSNESLDMRVKTAVRNKHHRECLAYDWLLTAHNPQFIPLPRIYHFEEKEENGEKQMNAIVMEELNERGRAVTIDSCLTTDQLFSVLDALVSLHAHSIKSEDKWQAKLLPLPMSYYENMQEDINLAREGLQKQKEAAEIEQRLERLKTQLSADGIRELLIDSCETDIPLALLHGDLRQTKLIFANDDTDKLIALIDWQNCHPGCIGEDLACLLANNLDGKVRQQQSDSLLRYYHQKLAAALLDTPHTITFDQVREAYIKLLPYALASLLSNLAPLLGDSGYGQQNDGHRKLWQQSVIDRIKILLDEMASVNGTTPEDPAPNSPFRPEQERSEDQGEILPLSKQDDTNTTEITPGN